jgi:hypothetical protein
VNLRHMSPTWGGWSSDLRWRGTGPGGCRPIDCRIHLAIAVDYPILRHLSRTKIAVAD